MFIRREFRPCLSLVLAASLWLVPVVLVHAGERTLPTQEEVRRWIATNLDTPPLFREGGVLIHKDLAKLQPFLSPGYIEEFDFTDVELHVSPSGNYTPQLTSVSFTPLPHRRGTRPFSPPEIRGNSPIRPAPSLENSTPKDPLTLPPESSPLLLCAMTVATGGGSGMAQAQIDIGKGADPEMIDPMASAAASCPIRPSGSFFPVPSFAERSPPALMKLNNGTVVNTQALWNTRRKELIELFRANMHGRWPTSLPSTGKPTTMSFSTTTPVTVTVTASGRPNIAAKRKNTTISYTGPGGTRTIRVVEYIPTATTGAKAAFLLINHRYANEISLTSLTAVKEYPEYFPVYEILARNYAAVSFMASDVDKDTTSDDPNSATTVSWTDGVHGAFPETRGSASWGTIGAWAWGASRVMDYLVGDPDIDDLRVAVIGHSRGGKAALWAGAQDTRFKLVISNESGTGGHAFSCGNSGRGCNGQQNQDLNDRYPSWFSTKYKTFNADPCGLLPVDAHMLIALSAPRAVYIGTTSQDDIDDNVGAFVAGQGAGQGSSTDPASNPWKLYSKSGFKLTRVPAGGTAAYWDTNGYVGYHRRTGAHGLRIQDWKHYMDFAAVRM